MYINFFFFFLCFFFLSKLLIQLKQLSHSVDKVEYIVMGGMFMALDDDYKDYFIRNLHDALSGHTSSSVHVQLGSCQVSPSHNSAFLSVL